ncbi:hypothetical protein [Pedobacter sp. SYP-B3415]|uniref:hypothetical protein n=1 Tax=Pedobacter sp. SYP-B3415 TaxID=2496641 RepID=UPI00101E0349|nr:hypothetical protein [Pedobacter sp. SYP-B3415]
MSHKTIVHNPEWIRKLYIENKDKINNSLKTSYHFSYPSLLAFFSREVLTADDVIAGIHMVYGWMPRVFSFYGRSKEMTERQNFEELFKKISYVQMILNKAKSHVELISLEEIQTLKMLFGNSVVGTSKLLHFVQPERYAIWDSRVCAVFSGRNRISHAMASNTVSFENYLKEMLVLVQTDEVREAVCDPVMASIRKHSENAGNLELSRITPLRALELILFSAGSDLNRQ